MDRRRRGHARASPDGHGAGPRRPTDRDHDPGWDAETDDRHLRARRLRAVHLPSSRPRGLRHGRDRRHHSIAVAPSRPIAALAPALLAYARKRALAPVLATALRSTTHARRTQSRPSTRPTRRGPPAVPAGRFRAWLARSAGAAGRHLRDQDRVDDRLVAALRGEG